MQTRITDFNIVVGLDDDDFVALVQKKLDEGWQPYGSPHITKSVDGRLIYRLCIAKHVPYDNRTEPNGK